MILNMNGLNAFTVLLLDVSGYGIRDMGYGYVPSYRRTRARYRAQALRLLYAARAGMVAACSVASAAVAVSAAGAGGEPAARCADNP